MLLPSSDILLASHWVNPNGNQVARESWEKVVHVGQLGSAQGERWKGANGRHPTHLFTISVDIMEVSILE